MHVSIMQNASSYIIPPALNKKEDLISEYNDALPLKIDEYLSA